MKKYKKLGYPSYKEYLKSEHWQNVRRKRLSNGRKCEYCGNGEFIEVHHKTYKRLGRERYSDLMLLCHNHHTALHKAELPEVFSIRALGVLRYYATYRTLTKA